MNLRLGSLGRAIRLESVRTGVARFWRQIQEDRRGQDLIEYALLGSFLTVAIAAIFPRTLSPNISTIFSKVSALLASAPNPPTP